jgi:ABC-2 type transport system permease protein
MRPHVFHGAALSYRALFTWLNPLGYLSSRIVRPIGLTITFTAVSSYYSGSIARVLVGASLLACAHAVVYGMSLAVANERTFGTLDFWLGSPQNKLGAICQRGLPHLLDGLLGGIITYVVCGALFGSFPVPVQVFAGVLLLVLVSSFGMGVLIASGALFVKDVFTLPNLAHLLLMVFSGALVGVNSLPGVLRPLCAVFPLYHATAFLAGWGAAGPGLVGTALAEAGVGVLWFLGGALLVRLFLRRRLRG